MSTLRAVSFDAGGTLLEVAEPVGATYARLGRAAGFAVEPDAMEEGFRRAFAASPPLAHVPSDGRSLFDFERAWWRSVVDASLAYALGAPPGDAHAAARERFFDAAFAHYASPSAWRLFPEVPGVIAELRRRGVVLLVISNFDRRLHALLDGFALGGEFAAMVASSEAGAVKPDPAIFAHARRALGDVPAAACLHVGDSLREDVAGALGAGWRGVWVDRQPGPTADALPPGAVRINSLAELPGLVQSASQSSSA